MPTAQLGAADGSGKLRDQGVLKKTQAQQEETSTTDFLPAARYGTTCREGQTDLPIS